MSPAEIKQLARALAPLVAQEMLKASAEAVGDGVRNNPPAGVDGLMVSRVRSAARSDLADALAKKQKRRSA